MEETFAATSSQTLAVFPSLDIMFDLRQQFVDASIALFVYESTSAGQILQRTP
jgi:hypothetical protein